MGGISPSAFSGEKVKSIYKGQEGRGQALRWRGQNGQKTHDSLTPLHDSRSRSSRWWRWERGQKKHPREGGRCHCIGGVHSYGAEILIEEEWGEIQVQDAEPGVAGEEKTRKTLKGWSSAG